MHYITVLRQQSARGGIIQPQRPNYLCWFPINPLSCFGSAARPGATCDIPMRYATAQRFYVSPCEILCERGGTSALPFTFKASQRPFLCPLSQIPDASPSASRLPCGRWLYAMESLRLTICKTALMVLTDGKAVNNRLRDKPLNLRGSLRKRLGAKMGYEIHGDTGCRRYVCLHAAREPMRAARVNDCLNIAAVSLN